MYWLLLRRSHNMDHLNSETWTVQKLVSVLWDVIWRISSLNSKKHLFYFFLVVKFFHQSSFLSCLFSFFNFSCVVTSPAGRGLRLNWMQELVTWWSQHQWFNQDGFIGCTDSSNDDFITKRFFGEHQPGVLLLVQTSSSTSSHSGGVGVDCAGGLSHHPGDCGGQRAGCRGGVHQPSPAAASESLPGVSGVSGHTGGHAGHPLLLGQWGTLSMNLLCFLSVGVGTCLGL